MNTLYSFNLPPKEDVIKRNRTITTYYAQLYKNEPELYKWAGMAAFASFHIGEKLEMWNWKKSGIKSISYTCSKKNRTIEDDFQVIRILNNAIFTEIGMLHLMFSQLSYTAFKSLLLEKKKDKMIIDAFEKLNEAKMLLPHSNIVRNINDIIWEANIEILWHEQSRVVQPLFEKLSDLFSGAMSLVASFDYNINHKKTNWTTTSRFISFILFRGFWLLTKKKVLPSVTNLEQRWYWISNDLLIRWRKIEAKEKKIMAEIELLSQIEKRHLKISRK